MLVCQAGTSFTQPQSKRTVPPRSGVVDRLHALLLQPVRNFDDRDALGAGAGRDRDRVGDVVDGGRWLTAIWVASTSSAARTAAGLLGLRKGSTRRRVSPSLSSKHEWPWKRISIFESLLGWSSGRDAAWPPQGRPGRRRRHRSGRRKHRRWNRRSVGRAGPPRRPQTPIASKSSSIAPCASERRIVNHAATAPRAMPLPPAITAMSPRESASRPQPASPGRRRQ